MDDTTSNPPSAQEVQAAIRRLGSLRKGVREAAMVELEGYGLSAIPQVEAHLEQDRKRGRVWRLVNSSLFCALGLKWICMLIMRESALSSPYLIDIVVLILSVWTSWRFLHRRWFLTVFAYGRLVPKKALSHFLDLLLFSSINQNIAVAEAAESSLRDISAEDRQVLTPGQCVLLVKYAITYPANERFFRAAMQALTHCGGEEVLPHLKEASENRFRKGPWSRLGPLAEETSLRIQDRLERERTEGALLRPAEAPEDDTLLRPAGPGVVEEGNLLRAVPGVPEPVDLQPTSFHPEQGLMQPVSGSSP